MACTGNRHQINPSGPTPRLMHSNQYKPTQLSLATPPQSDIISTRLVSPKPLKSELNIPLFTDTAMDLESDALVLFSVHPPSPIESDLCSDDQEALVRTWSTSGPTTEQLLGKGHTGELCTTSGKSINSATPYSASEQDNSNKHVNGTVDSPDKKIRNLRQRENNKKAELYKTELCISVHTGLVCKYGDNCQFAHSVAELQHVNRHPRYKTQLCTSFQNQGSCKYNDRCTFIHYPEEARVPISPSLFRKNVSSHIAHPAPRQTPNTLITKQNSSACAPVARSKSTMAASNMQYAEFNKGGIDRARSMSEPCISSYMGSSFNMQQTLNMKDHEQGINGSRYADSMAASIDIDNPVVQHAHTVLTMPMPNDPFQSIQQGQQESIPFAMKRRRRMAICYPSDGSPSQSRDIFDLLPHYNEHGMFDPDLAGLRPRNIVCPPWLTPDSIWQPINKLALGSHPNPNKSQNSTWDQDQIIPESHQPVAVESACDDEWISTLGRYIATPQNDFEI
ncbi:hypothetical protein FBU30_010743 [Linnemannia zychae]|nr:hypothetical protein FBU30_010743 [Linnemannia zychae]